MAIRFSYSDEFKKEFERFAKKRRSIGALEGAGDFDALKLILAANPTNNVAVERINNLWSEVVYPVYKVRKFYCQDLKNSGKIRLIYVYKEQSDEIQFVQFIEMYAKADKDNEDRERIRKYAR